jgi:hypothetical protein
MGHQESKTPTGMLPPAPEPEAPGKHPYMHLSLLNWQIAHSSAI